MNYRRFQQTVWGHFREHGRDLPWRKGISPYRIVVSEIMLQQTQASRVVPKYRSFLKLYPNFKSLAAASNADVLREWSGLGYNRRALYLKRLAEAVIEQYAGRLPREEGELAALPGIGRNTAGAIRVYAFNEPAVFIETNIRRVYLHHFFPGRDGVSDADLLPLVERTVDTGNPREWYWALMDYGSYLAGVMENPNRRSRHYVRQSKFEGSTRQLRGIITRELLKGTKTPRELAAASAFPRDQVTAALKRLLAEGMVRKAGGKYRLA